MYIHARAPRRQHHTTAPLNSAQRQRDLDLLRESAKGLIRDSHDFQQVSDYLQQLISQHRTGRALQ